MRPDHFRFERKQQQRHLATRRQIGDWLIYHIPLKENKEFDFYVFRLFLNLDYWIPYSGVQINHHFANPWDAYNYAVEEIYKDRGLRKRFLDLYYRS